ncbi:MAG: hypothetical protein GWN99_16240 [Gemmatimonadetes bacterium]|uniref:Anti-sigma factor RsiW n=1 Tax=Candidatus Kutchimonas denitrificans TaxID=3056748 RepID=A0AAE4Z7C1_9BACT|nr:hypothetical protein [Gemmatimonadota bacterium]NIR74338.1 hypothetical protein [Candidatus Kutchimonas denitrificans]NIS02589.1 hypothetical protein [Gemmatimonadota bacterium]NIT68464.1 hypothetical protein [Gemmatimonadota bacterium]NIU51941.1 hypothetical protein [Gemmatimonadota bacterium]
MDCTEVKRVLWPADVLRVSDSELEAALEHAEDCPDCGHFLEADRRLARLIRESVPREPAPAELRERLYTALARERAGSPGPRRRFRFGRWPTVAGALAVGTVVGAAIYWWGGQGAMPSATAFAEDYLRRVVEQEALVSGDPQEVSAFFARELGVALPPPVVPGYELQRATICLMNGRRGGVVEYAAGDRSFSYYLVPQDRPVTRRGNRVDVRMVDDSVTDPPFALGRARGLGVATWWDEEHRHALVGDLPVAELERLAPLFIDATLRL